MPKDKSLSSDNNVPQSSSYNTSFTNEKTVYDKSVYHYSETLKVLDTTQQNKQQKQRVRAWISSADNLNKGNYYIHFMNEEEIRKFTNSKDSYPDLNLVFDPNIGSDDIALPRESNFEQPNSLKKARFSTMKKYEKMNEENVLLHSDSDITDHHRTLRIIKQKDKLLHPAISKPPKKLFVYFSIVISCFILISFAVELYIFIFVSVRFSNISKIQTIFFGKIAISKILIYTERILTFTQQQNRTLASSYKSFVYSLDISGVFSA